MKVVILYRPRSEQARAVETFVHDFQHRYAGAKLELVNVDEREGIAMASLYDVMRFPCILVVTVDGILLHLWQDEQLPLMDNVASYLQQR